MANPLLEQLSTRAGVQRYFATTQGQQKLIAGLRKSLDIPALAPPFSTLSQYVQFWQMARGSALSIAEYQGAVARANAIADSLQAQTNQRLTRLWEEGRFSQRAQRALASGAEFASQQGQDLSTANAPMLLGAFGVGFLLGLIPFERQNFLEDFRAVVEGLSPAERFLVFSTLRDNLNTVTTLVRFHREGTNPANFREVRGPWPPWRSNNPGFPAHYVVNSPLDTLPGVFMPELLFEYDCAPDESPKARAYILAMLCSYHEDTQRISEMREYFSRAQRGAFRSGWITRALLDNKDKTCGEIRTEARSFGLEDFGTRLLTPKIIGLLERQYTQ